MHFLKHDQLELRPCFLPWVSKNRLYRIFRALSDERFGRCGCKAARPLRNRFWKRLHWYLRKTLANVTRAAWPLRVRRLSSLETAAAKPLGYVRRAFFSRRSSSGSELISNTTFRSNGKSWTEAARPLLPCHPGRLAATKLQRFSGGQPVRVTWQKRPGRQHCSG